MIGTVVEYICTLCKDKTHCLVVDEGMIPSALMCGCGAHALLNENGVSAKDVKIELQLARPEKDEMENMPLLWRQYVEKGGLCFVGITSYRRHPAYDGVCKN